MCTNPLCTDVPPCTGTPSLPGYLPTPDNPPPSGRASLKTSSGLGQTSAMLIREQKRRSGRNREQPAVPKPELHRKAHYANAAGLLLTLRHQQTTRLRGLPSSWQHESNAGPEGSSGHRMGMRFLPCLGGRDPSPRLRHVASSSRSCGAPKDDAAEQFVLWEDFFISVWTSLPSLTAFKCR